ncbi:MULTISPECIES: hypothetical protein [Roseobacteraceae]|uniref:hypothetical protein n=1 Tax=Roseobacteraceae TaxID=2854170 RepID=UPI0031D1AD5E
MSPLELDQDLDELLQRFLELSGEASKCSAIRAALLSCMARVGSPEGEASELPDGDPGTDQERETLQTSSGRLSTEGFWAALNAKSGVVQHLPTHPDQQALNEWFLFGPKNARIEQLVRKLALEHGYRVNAVENLVVHALEDALARAEGVVLPSDDR